MGGFRLLPILVLAVLLAAFVFHRPTRPPPPQPVQSSPGAGAAASSAASETAADLENLRHEPVAERREELYDKLAFSGSPQALKGLWAEYQQGKEETREAIIEALQFFNGDDITPILPFYADALKPSQPDALRSVASESLQNFTDPRTVAVWQTLKDDRDDQIRETARGLIETYSP